jgi:glycine dehydrogenase
MVADLTRLEVANASMLDEGTAAAEAMTLMHRAMRGPSNRLAVDTDVYRQTAAILATRAEPLGIEIVAADLRAGLPDGDFFGVITQLPGASGEVVDWTELVAAAHERGALVAVGSDLLALTLIAPPGEIGADVAFGSTQRFGVPMGFGGPHAGYLAVHAKHARQLPGRLVGVSQDADGAPAYRLALQTREQHIRRDKATSNICTAQVLLAVIAAMYASYHGADGLAGIARRVHGRAEAVAGALGDALVHPKFFDTVLARVPGRADDVIAAAKADGINLWRVDDDHVSVSCDEATTDEHVATVIKAFGVASAEPVRSDIASRTSEFLTHPAFTQYRTETEMMRYLRSLADKDIALDRSMIPLGSCTMKLNAAAEMEPITWPEFSRQHPFAPASDTPGLRKLIADLETWLTAMTGYDAVSLQPNAGSQGEHAGLLAIQAYHAERGQPDREVCLIPSSAHGTNAASAALAGMRVVVVACRANGDVDLDDLRAKVAEHADRLSALMITYPSTHGVYEHDIVEICTAVHDVGGQVYVDGANLNALVGLARPGRFGGDVSHLNLHKTFCIPHGGGGPGVGPVAVREHLAKYLPGHPLAEELSEKYAVSRRRTVRRRSFRSPGRSDDGRRAARGVADRDRRRTISPAALASTIRSKHGRTAWWPTSASGSARHHERHRCHRRRCGETLGGLRLHAPTMSFPVAGTLMVEPTESESEVDAFCEAMIAIRGEIDQVGAGTWSVDKPLRGAPHTAECLLVADWDHPYTREEVAHPLGKGSGPCGRRRCAASTRFTDRNPVLVPASRGVRVICRDTVSFVAAKCGWPQNDT